ncbi:Dabb family protein [Corallococcus llansteffanensis]|uniref:Dabb family protein n=1 Tax=Corallococcus llansteffanensis TaxID=2316731 RepID=A0A3A8QMI1_9BACT|nr:Dabb family protein [Corallococcus llansteffanensis]RKH69031.1 Dabb family protein [Corallococcus llansteffanensis]
MFVNLLRFRFKDGVTEAEQAQALAAITRTSKTDAVSFSVVGRDLGDPAEGYTHAYCVGIADLSALQKYFDAPEHREGDLLFLPRVARLRRIALTDDADPALGEKIQALHREKMAGDPEWAALLAAIPVIEL